MEIDLTIVGEGPDVDGITFTKFLALPNPNDAGRMTRNAQPMVDFKMSMIKDTVEALGGEVKGAQFSIPDNAICKIQVEKEVNAETGRPYNRLVEPIMTYSGAATAKPKAS